MSIRNACDRSKLLQWTSIVPRIVKVLAVQLKKNNKISITWTSTLIEAFDKEKITFFK